MKIKSFSLSPTICLSQWFITVCLWPYCINNFSHHNYCLIIDVFARVKIKGKCTNHRKESSSERSWRKYVPLF